MLTDRITPSALGTKALLGFASLILLGVVTAMPARADIKIGFQVPLTGPAATDGKSAQIACEMAIEDINAAGGVLGQKLRARHLRRSGRNRTRRSSPPTS